MYSVHSTKREDFSLVLGHAWLVKGGVHNRSFVVAFYSLIKTSSEQLAVKNIFFIRNNYRLILLILVTVVVIKWQFDYIVLFPFVHNFHPNYNHTFNISSLMKRNNFADQTYRIWMNIIVNIYVQKEWRRKKEIPAHFKFSQHVLPI